MPGNRIVGMLVESPTGFGCPNQSRAELWGEETDGDEFGSDDVQGARRVDSVLVSQNAFDVPEGSVAGRGAHPINVPISCPPHTACSDSARICADNLNVVSFLNADVPSVDLRSALDGVARRWWVVVVCVIVAIGVVFAQDSGLRSEPNGDVIVERTYEAAVEVDELAIVKIDPAAITPVPSFDNQLGILRSDATLEELRGLANSQDAVEVTRTEPKFTIVETIDDLNNKVSFLSTGTPAYTFRCTGTEMESCSRLLDEFVAKTTTLRKDSVLSGLEGGLTLTSTLIKDAQKRLESGSLGAEERSAQLTELASLVTKHDALELAASKVSGALMLVSEGSWVEGKTTKSVTASTYGFGFGVGLVLGLLLALQLAAMDKKIRHAWQVRRVDENLNVIGSPFARNDAGQVTALAAALHTAQRDGAGSALVVAEHPSLIDFARSVAAEVPELATTIIESTNTPTVDQLSGPPSQVALVLVKAGHTTRRALAESIGIVTAGGSRLLGVALID